MDIRGVMICGSDVSLSPGDRVAARFSIKETIDSSAARKDGLLLSAYLDDGEGAYVQRVPDDQSLWDTLCSTSGFRIVSNRIRDRLGARLETLLGAEKGALASGFLMGDRSKIEAEIERDFRRSGTSHQMAVSGLHITVLLGGIELLLRKLYVTKPVRCIAISFLSIAFLFLTGFSLSACRSVLMLYAVYVSYMLYDDHDSLTALFASITVIVLVSPYSVNDLGMWMSFFATLGLLTVYPLCEASIPYPRQKNPWVRRTLRAGRSLLLGALMTVIANLFLLFLVWLIFGEISLVAVPGNLALSLPAYAFLLGVPILLLLGSVPLLGEILCPIIGALGEAIIGIVSYFSSLPNAMLSLSYEFAGVIILLFSATGAIFLVIRLPKKWMLAIPPVAAALAFVICFGTYHWIHREPAMIYSYSDNNEMISVREGTTVSVCDLSFGGNDGYFMLSDEVLAAHATEVRAFVLTHYHKGHRTMLELCLQDVIVRELYLPTPQNTEEAILGEELWRLAVEDGTEVIFYDADTSIVLTDSICARSSFTAKDGRSSLLLSIYSNSDVWTYLSPSLYGTGHEEAAMERMWLSQGVIFGSHETSHETTFFFDLTEQEPPETVIYTSEAVFRNSKCRTGDASVYIYREKKPYRISFSFQENQS